MRNRRTDVVERALAVLDQYGLPDLSMRRIAADLGVQPSALYHHFASKQLLLAAVADEILGRGAGPESASAASWDERVLAGSHSLRDAVLAYRDGAELVATVHAFGLGGHQPGERIAADLMAAGFEASFAREASTTMVHFVLGHAMDEQLHLQANSAGAIDAAPLGDPDATRASSFALGLSLIVDGVRLRHPAGAVS